MEQEIAENAEMKGIRELLPVTIYVTSSQ